MFRRPVVALFAAVSVAVLGTSCSTDAPGSSGGGDGVEGVGSGVSERPSAPFQPSDEVGEKPPVPDTLAAAMNVVNAEVFAQTAEAMEQAAKDAGMDFTQTAADGDPNKNIEQLNTLLNRGVGAVFVWDLDIAAQRPVNKRLMDTGAAVFTLSSGPSTMPIVANQEDVGNAVADTVEQYITGELGGQAKVVLFNEDNLENIQPRYHPVRDRLAQLGSGVELVSDVTVDSADPDFGFTAMNSVLQAHPDVDVVIGVDPVLVSALKAVQAAGTDTSRMGFFGVGGDAAAFDEIRKGGPYKASFAFNTPIIGYAAGVWGADWINGKQIPSLLLVTPVALTNAAAIDEFSADLSDPAGAFENKRDAYLEPLGNISYETRQNYWNEEDPK